MPLDYAFGERLAMSQGVSEGASVKAILLDNIPSALQAIPAHEKNDRHGTDWWVECQSGAFLSVDCKVREKDWAAAHPKEDDLALETFSVLESNIIGWTRDKSKRTDYVLWLWSDTGRWTLLPFQMLCHAFGKRWHDWRDMYKTKRQHTPGRNGGWHSECVFVPRREVWAAIYRDFAGNLNGR